MENIPFNIMNDISLTLHHGNCIDFMTTMEPCSIDLTVTSPPYDDIRSYDNTLNWNWDIFQRVAQGLYCITKEGGTVVWIVNDSTKNGSETGNSFKQALHFQKLGFNLHDTMIYQKKNYMPLNHNRYDPCFEYMFVFTNGKPKTFNPLLTACKTAGEAYNYKNRTSGSTTEKAASMRKRDEDKVTKTHKYRSNIWEYDTGKNKGSNDDIWEHPATFPEKLAEDHILSWSNEGDIIFDPFSGSGTTGKMALLNNRSYIGTEVVGKYHKIATNRLGRFELMHELITM